MAIPGKPFRVVIMNALGDTCLVDVFHRFPKNLIAYTIQDLLIEVDNTHRGYHANVNWKDYFWNCGADMHHWHSNNHSWRFTLPGDSVLIDRDAFVNDHLITVDGSIEFHLQAIRVKTIFDDRPQTVIEARTIEFLTSKFGHGPDSLRSGCPDHYCNDCGLGGQTFWMHPTPNKHFRDFSYQQSVKLDQPPLMCSDCAVEWLEDYID